MDRELCDDCADVALRGASVTASEKDVADLLKLLGKSDRDDHAFLNLTRLLPGLKYGAPRDSKGSHSIYDLQRNDIQKRTRNRRLGSPHYYRYYFAFGQAGGDFPEETAKPILNLIGKDQLGFSEKMIELASEPRVQGGVMLLPMLDRIEAHLDSFSSSEIRAVLVPSRKGTGLGTRRHK